MMTTATNDIATRIAKVMDYATGMEIGEATISLMDARKYVDEIHPEFQWPEGIAKAGDVLPDFDAAPRP